ncbi:unnamed protein product [Allacma fusca]|uniref:Uncharacterized protein n=1 Tax=Allacma fusca TaxID=39272 RepID=A0A8J2NPS2_9HEXA|nr:unnamed protein product [Allacma fusca]
MDPATEFSVKEVEAVQELRKRVADLEPKFKSDFLRQDLSLLRFLRARELNLNKSEEMLRKHINWRAENQVDNILNEQIYPQFFEDFPVKLSGRDKEGYLVATAPVGKFDFRSMVESGLKDEFVLFVVQWFERVLDICDQMSTKEKFYSQLCVVFDFEGFEYKQLASKAVISMVIELIQIFEANYPEILRVVWIVNAPAIFNVLWGVIKPFLTERTNSKIRIFGSNKNKWRTDILNMIDEDNIPSEFSGANTCCPDYNNDTDFDLKKISPRFQTFGLEDMTKVFVGARQTYTVQVNASSGTEINWNFATEKCDINFRVNFETDEEVIRPCRVDSHLCTQKGKISCETSGLYTLVFDNTYSSFKGKSLRYIVWTS